MVINEVNAFRSYKHIKVECAPNILQFFIRNYSYPRIANDCLTDAFVPSFIFPIVTAYFSLNLKINKRFSVSRPISKNTSQRGFTYARSPVVKIVFSSSLSDFLINLRVQNAWMVHSYIARAACNTPVHSFEWIMVSSISVIFELFQILSPGVPKI